MTNKEKALEWIASSYKDLMALPPDVRRRFGYALSLAQMGDQDDAAKVLKGFGGAGVLEVVEDDAGGTYRAVYTVKYAEAVWGLGSNGTGNSDRCSSCPTTSSIIHCWITQGTQGAFCHGFRDRQRISSLHVDMVVDMRRQTGHVLDANVEPFFA
jgi:phage-related protein